MINAKKKGNRGENEFASWLSENGIKAWKDSASGGGNREKADVGNDINAHFEVKTVKSLNLNKVWKKALLECSKTRNTPYIVIHFDGMPKNEWLMVMDNYSWLEMFRKSIGKTLIDVKEDNQKLKWKLRNLKQLCGEIDRLLEN